MGQVRIVYSKLPAIAASLPREEEKAISDASQELVAVLKAAVWRRHGFVAASVKDHSEDALKMDIHVGEIIGGLGFYAGFQEFGTIKQAPRPLVTPWYHVFEPRLLQIVAEGLRKAANAS